jgi:hypothetical protein
MGERRGEAERERLGTLDVGDEEGVVSIVRGSLRSGGYKGL